MLFLAPQSPVGETDACPNTAEEYSNCVIGQPTLQRGHLRRFVSIPTRSRQAFQEKAVQLKHLGLDKLVPQLNRVSAALDAGKAAVREAGDCWILNRPSS